MLKLSRHTLFYNDYPKSGEYLLYQTRTQAIMQVNREVKDFIHKITISNDNISNDEQQCLNTLKETGIIIEQNVDENRILEHWFNQIKYHSKALNVTILTTYQCNFGCSYCFEERVKHSKSMDETTCQKVVDWLKRKIKERHPESLRLMFYGGEPMMNPKAILSIATALNQWTQEQDVRFSFGMISNGSLLKKDLIEQMVKLGLTSIRVTLDGDKAHHDRRRPFLDGRGSFDAIVRNINEVLEIKGVGIEISGNFDRDNFQSFWTLLDYLEETGMSNRISGVFFAPVVARLGEKSKDGSAPSVEMVGCHTLGGDMADDALKLRKEIIQRGYKVDPAAVVITCPMLKDDSMLVVDPYGDIYKCPTFVGRQEFSIGNVAQPYFNYRNAEFMTLNHWKDCLDCVYLPMCGGGCRYLAQIKHSDYTKKSCDIEFYERIFPRMLKMDYERGAL